MANLIDIHRHWAPAAFQQTLHNSPGQSPSQSSDVVSDLGSPSKAKANGTAILSTTWPGAIIAPNPQDSRRLARAMNGQSADLVQANSRMYGFFAAMPCFTDIVGTVAEIKHSIDEQDADGILAFTSYGRKGLYLGHEDFVGIWQQLNVRKAVVFVHPCPPCSQRDRMTIDNQDWPEETAKAAFDLLMSGRLQANQDVKVVLAHGGGTFLSRLRASSRADLAQEARRFYFDTAGVTDAALLADVLQFAPADHVLYGTDLPFAPSSGGKQSWTLLEQALAPRGGAALVLRENALRLFPRLA